MKIWPRTSQDLESKPCLAAPPCAASCFECRPDWRLDLVLNAGNLGCSDVIPVFESTDAAGFEEAVQSAMKQTLECCGYISKESIELPYNLCRYRDDAPPGSPNESPERRWVRALAPEFLDTVQKIGYKSLYGWSMRHRLD